MQCLRGKMMTRCCSETTWRRARPSCSSIPTTTPSAAPDGAAVPWSVNPAQRTVSHPPVSVARERDHPCRYCRLYTLPAAARASRASPPVCWPHVPVCAGRVDADRAFLAVGPANAGGIVAVGCRRLLHLCAHQLPSSVRAGHLGGVFTWLFCVFCTDSVRVSSFGDHKMCARAPIISCTCMCHLGVARLP